jgi:hypothetical protein
MNSFEIRAAALEVLTNVCPTTLEDLEAVLAEAARLGKDYLFAEPRLDFDEEDNSRSSSASSE